jgi:ABC-type antimicrobial peptide transport system permease subunit
VALGATRAGVVRLVLRQAGWMVLAGVVPGLAGAWAAGHAVRSFLFGVRPLDLASFAAAVGILLLAATMAATLPAWRAARVDPIEALRIE